MTLSRRFADWISDHPKRSFALGLAIVAFFAAGLPRIIPDFSYRIWFQESNPKLKLFDAFERRFGSDEVSVVVIHSPSGIFDAESIGLIRDMTDDFWKAPEVIRVDSLTNFNWVHGEGDEIIVEPLIPPATGDRARELTLELLEGRKKVALEHPTINGYLINKEADTAILFARLKPALGTTPNYENVILNTREILKKYEGRGDHTFYLTGSPALNFAFKESSQQDMKRLIPFVLLLIIASLWLSLRRVGGLVITLVIIAFTIFATMGFSGWAGVKLNNMTAIVPQFMIAIAISVAIHLMVQYYSALRRGMPKREAIRHSAQMNFKATLLTTITTMVGFFSFATAPIPPIMEMGLLSGVGTAFSWVITYLIGLPLLLALPTKPGSGASETTAHAPSPLSARFAEWVHDYRKPIVIFSSAMGLAGILLSLQIPINSDPFKYFSEKYPMTIATNFVEKKVGGAMGAEIVIDSGTPEGIKDPDFLQRVEKLQLWLDALPFVSKTVSIINILKDVNQTLNGGLKENYRLSDSRDAVAQQIFLYSMSLPQGMDLNDRMSVQNDAIRLTAMWTIHDSETVLKTIDEIESKARDLGLNAHVTGKAPLYQSNNELVVWSFLTSIAIAIFVIAGILIYGLKSFRLGLLSVVPNTLPLFIGGGFIHLMGQPLDIGTMIVGSVCLGIAVDDTIHFLTHYQEAIHKGADTKTAIARTYAASGRAMILTTLTLMAAFGTFIFATFVPNQNFGMFVAMILGTALLFDLIFLPALLLVSGRWLSPQTAPTRPRQWPAENATAMTH